jgi:hypothetical protein
VTQCKLATTTTLGSGHTTLCSLDLDTGDHFLIGNLGWDIAGAGTINITMGFDASSGTLATTGVISGTVPGPADGTQNMTIFASLDAPDTITFWASNSGAATAHATVPQTGAVTVESANEPVLAAILAAVTKTYPPS